MTLKGSTYLVEEFRGHLLEILSEAKSIIRVYGYDQQVDKPVLIDFLKGLKEYLEIRAIVQTGNYPRELKNLAKVKTMKELPTPVSASNGSIRFRYGIGTNTLFKTIDARHVMKTYPRWEITSSGTCGRVIIRDDPVTASKLNYAFDELFGELS